MLAALWHWQPKIRAMSLEPAAAALPAVPPAALPAVPPARTALVTGASRGIGQAIATGLAEAGLQVALLATNADLLAEVVADIRARLGQASVLPVVTDVSDAAAVSAATAEVLDAFGSVDLLVNAAGVIDAEVPAWESDPEQWWRIFEVNVRGPYLLAHALVPLMLARGGGRIVDLSSGAASHPMATASAYNASKTALLRLGEHLALAGALGGLRVFEVAPGVVQTDMTASMQMHAGRTDWTPVAQTVQMVLAIARGELDACSGWFIRVTDDTPETLAGYVAASAANGSGRGSGRKLRVQPAGADDALATILGR